MFISRSEDTDAKDDAIVIPPSALVMVTLVPAVRVDTAGPEVPPISSCPLVDIATAAKVSSPESCVIITALSANAVAFVPPLATGSVPLTLEAKATVDKNPELLLLQLAKLIWDSAISKEISFAAVVDIVSILLADLIPFKLITFLSVTSTNKAIPVTPDLDCKVGKRLDTPNFLLSPLAELAVRKKSFAVTLVLPSVVKSVMLAI